MALSKKKASLLNMITMGVYQAITIVLGFVLPKLLLNTYGAELHGYTSTVTNIMSYILLLNAGIGAAGIQALYSPLANRDNHRISEVVNAIDKFYIKTGILFTVAISACAFVLPFVIKSDIPNWQISSLMFAMGSTSTLECFIYSKHKILLQADQRLFIVNITDTIALILRSFSQILLILGNYDIVLVEAIPTVIVLFRMVVLSWFVKYNYSEIDKHVTPDFSTLSKRWSAFVHQITALVVNNTDVILLTFFSGLTEVSIYSVYNLVFSHLYSFMLSVFSNATLASFGILISEKREKKLQEMYDIFEYAYYIVIAIVYSLAACLILPFVQVYTEGMDGIPYVDTRLAILFVLVGTLNNLRVPCNTMITAAGHFKETQKRAILEAFLNLSISLVLVQFWGVYGLLIGTFCSFTYRVTDMIIYTHKHILHMNSCKSWTRILRVACLIFFNLFVFFRLFDWKSIVRWKLWFLDALKIGFISVVICLCVNIVFDIKSFKRLCSLFLKKINVPQHSNGHNLP